MAVHQLSRPTDIGELFGQGLGTGLGKIIDAKTTQKGLEAIGYSHDEAKNIAFSHHPTLIKQAIQAKFGASKAQQQNSYLQETIGNIQRGYAVNPEQNQQQQINPQAQSQPQRTLNVQPSAQETALQKLNASPFEHLINPETNQYDNATSALKQLQNAPYDDIAQKLMQQVQQPQQARQQQAPVVQEKKPFTAADVDWQRLNPEGALAVRTAFNQQQKAAKEEKIESFKRSKEAHKETKVYYDELIKKEKSAEQDDIRLGRLEKLVKNGKLPNSALWSTLTKLEETGIGTFATAGAGLGGLIGAAGGPLSAPAAATGAIVGGIAGALISPLAGVIKTGIRATSSDIEEFEKLSTDFVKNAKQYFGSRLTDADLKAFMSTIPTLMQTDAGKLKVINNLREFNKISKTESQLARQIIRANGGLRPPNLDALVHDALSPEIDKLAEQFMK